MLLRLADRDLSVLMRLQDGRRREVNGPKQKIAAGHATIVSVECHIPDRMCVSALPSATAALNELLAAPCGEIRLPYKMFRPPDAEMRPLQVTPGRLHPVAHKILGSPTQDASSGLTVAIERTHVSLAVGLQMWSAGSERAYPIAETCYTVRGPAALSPVLIPMAAYPCFQVRVEWNARVLDPRNDDEEPWTVGTGLESVTESDENNLIWLERTQAVPHRSIGPTP
jgi:hypothetical protein